MPPLLRCLLAPCLLACLTGGAAAQSAPDAAAGADELQAEEGALRITAAALDRLVVGVRTVPLDGGPVDVVVRGLLGGLVSVEVQRGDLRWRGRVRTVPGRVEAFDADAALASAEAVRLDATAGARFDLFAFYDDLDAQPGLAATVARCDSVLPSVPDGPERVLAVKTCEGARARLARGTPDQPSDDRPEADALRRADGRLRAAPAGTAPRVVIGGLGLAAAGAFVGVTFGAEVAAERAYVAHRAADRFGDDRTAVEQLAAARTWDDRRDAAIGGAVAGAVAAVISFAWQGADDRALRRARTTAWAAPAGRGAAVGLAVRW